MKCQFLINGIPCGTVIPNGEKFCANCGAPASVEVEVYKCITKPCLHCGHSLTKGHKFCSNCAWKVDQSIFEQEGLTCKGVNQNGVVCGQKLLPSAKFCPECATPVLHRESEVDPVQKSVNNTEQLELVFGAMKNTNGKSQAEDQNVTNQASTRKNQMRDESLQRPDRFMDSIIFGRQEDSFNETARRYEHMEDDSVIHRNDRMRKKDYKPVGDKQKKQNNEEADHKKENIDDGEISRDCSTYSSYGDREKTNPSLKRETGKKKEKKNKDEKKREKKKMKEMNSGSSEKSYDEAISSKYFCRKFLLC